MREKKKYTMANKWNIPESMENEIRKRDTVCVYCCNPFTLPKESVRSAPSWEHIINDIEIITRENIALCCRGCNSSKGQKQLSEWLGSMYCKTHGITPESVAPIVKLAIENGQ